MGRAAGTVNAPPCRAQRLEDSSLLLRRPGSSTWIVRDGRGREPRGSISNSVAVTQSRAFDYVANSADVPGQSYRVRVGARGRECER